MTSLWAHITPVYWSDWFHWDPWAGRTGSCWSCTDSQSDISRLPEQVFVRLTSCLALLCIHQQKKLEQTQGCLHYLCRVYIIISSELCLLPNTETQGCRFQVEKPFRVKSGLMWTYSGSTHVHNGSHTDHKTTWSRPKNDSVTFTLSD